MESRGDSSRPTEKMSACAKSNCSKTTLGITCACNVEETVAPNDDASLVDTDKLALGLILNRRLRG
jgi:hypothetical protein